MTRYIRETK